MLNQEVKVKTIARVNDVAIVLLPVENEPVPIRPICQVLGIDESSQRQRIERDEILSSTAVMITAVAADGKEREMFCIPFKYVFGWMFSIDTSRVNEDAREAVTRYKMLCYDALYEYFTEAKVFLNEKQKKMNTYIDELNIAKANFRDAKKVMDEKQKLFDKVRKMTIEEWKADAMQQKLEFTEFQTVKE